ncbi:MAG: hypothetical protein M9962_12535 [Oligoflexia bacterium]|nr:hypothetical protein [Oligoflexia bacterium]
MNAQRKKASDQKKILKILAPSIWVHVLDDWCTDEDLWPKNRTIKRFHEWFDLQFSSMPIDFVENEIERIDFNEPAIF